LLLLAGAERSLDRDREFVASLTSEAKASLNALPYPPKRLGAMAANITKLATKALSERQH